MTVDKCRQQGNSQQHDRWYVNITLKISHNSDVSTSNATVCCWQLQENFSEIQNTSKVAGLITETQSAFLHIVLKFQFHHSAYCAKIPTPSCLFPGSKAKQFGDY